MKILLGDRELDNKSRSDTKLALQMNRTLIFGENLLDDVEP